jgi:hypothetical protein
LLGPPPPQKPPPQIHPTTANPREPNKIVPFLKKYGITTDVDHHKT